MNKDKDYRSPANNKQAINNMALDVLAEIALVELLKLHKKRNPSFADNSNVSSVSFERLRAQ